MKLRLTYNFVKSEIEKNPDHYVLQSKEYINNHTKLKIKCLKCDIVFYQAWNHWQYGKHCPKCGYKKMAEKLRLDYQYVKSEVEKDSKYIFISKNYKNAHTHFRVKCVRCNFGFQVTWANWRGGCRCPKCAGNLKPTIEQVKLEIESTKEYILFSQEYVNNTSNLEIQHKKCGTKFLMSWNAWKSQNQRCPKCGMIKGHDKMRLSFTYVRSEIEKNSKYILLSDTYKNNLTNLKVRCLKCGGVFWTTYSNKTGCPTCAGNQKLTIEFIRSEIEKDSEYILFSNTYENNHTKLKIKCLICGAVFWKTWNHWKTGERCSKCLCLRSKSEIVVGNFIYPFWDCVFNDRCTVINPITNKYLELDFWFPELRKAIEYNGNWTHGEDFPYTKVKDSIKKEQCEKLGIELLIIWDSDFLKDKTQTYMRIFDFLEN